MPRTIQVAAIQMDARPAPTTDRLDRANKLVIEAAQAGAELVVLPEIFNTGYGYSDENHRRAEPLTGPTVTWMKETAARFNLHLAGSLMLLDQDEVYNALLLFAPDGRMWRYDKNYPWGWERGYFRDGHHITIASTALGDLGLLVCWDLAHPDLWRRYAGQVDMMLVSSCPPDVGNPTYSFPNGDQLRYDDVGLSHLKESGQLIFDEMFRQQAAWLQTPAVNTVGTGHIETAIPRARLALLSLLPLAPGPVLKHLSRADRMVMACDFVPGCQVVDGEGRPLAKLSQADGEDFTLAEVTLPDKKPVPDQPQPRSPVPASTYFLSDILLPLLMISVYRQGLRRAWGRHMAPVQAATRRWLAGLGVAAGLAFWIGVIVGRNQTKRG